MNERAKELANNTLSTTAEIASGMLLLAKAGMDAEDLADYKPKDFRRTISRRNNNNRE